MSNPHRPGLPADLDSADQGTLDTADQEKQAKDEAVVNAGFWRKVRGTIGRVPFIEDVVAAWYCARDDRTPGYVRAIIMAALAYFVVPTDAIPDLVAGFGFTDDASVITAAVAAISSHLKDAHRNQARTWLGKPDLPDGDGPVAS